MSMSEIDLFWVTIDLGWIQSLSLFEKSFEFGGGLATVVSSSRRKFGLHEAGIQIWCFPKKRPSLVYSPLSLWVFFFFWFFIIFIVKSDTFGLCISQPNLFPLSDFVLFIFFAICRFCTLDFQVILSLKLKLERCISIFTSFLCSLEVESWKEEFLFFFWSKKGKKKFRSIQRRG